MLEEGIWLWHPQLSALRRRWQRSLPPVGGTAVRARRGSPSGPRPDGGELQQAARPARQSCPGLPPQRFRFAQAALSCFFAVALFVSVHPLSSWSLSSSFGLSSSKVVLLSFLGSLERLAAVFSPRTPASSETQIPDLFLAAQTLVRRLHKSLPSVLVSCRSFSFPLAATPSLSLALSFFLLRTETRRPGNASFPAFSPG